MTKVLVLYHSVNGHIEKMAKAEADGAADVSNVEVTLRRVPETMPEARRTKTSSSRRRTNWLDMTPSFSELRLGSEICQARCARSWIRQVACGPRDC
jgi:hypothetical protein